MKAFKYEVPMNDDTRLALLEQSIGHINESLVRIEKRFDSVDKRFDSLETKIEDVRKNSWSQFRWIMGLIFAVVSGFIGMIIKGHFG
jgi:hypothetical protein